MGQTFFTIVIHSKMALLNAGRSRGGNCGPGKKCNLHPPLPAPAFTSSTLAVVDDAGNSSSTCLSLSHWALIHQPKLKNVQLFIYIFCILAYCIGILSIVWQLSLLFFPNQSFLLWNCIQHRVQWIIRYSNIKHYSLTSDPTLWSLICARCFLI